MILRALLAFAGLGSAAAFGYRGDWAAAGLAGAVVLLSLSPVIAELRVAREDAVALLREAAQPPPAPRLEPVSCRPPWETAPMPVIPSADGGPAAGRHRAKRGPLDVIGDALGALREAYLP